MVDGNKNKTLVEIKWLITSKKGIVGGRGGLAHFSKTTAPIPKIMRYFEFNTNSTYTANSRFIGMCQCSTFRQRIRSQCHLRLASCRKNYTREYAKKKLAPILSENVTNKPVHIISPLEKQKPSYNRARNNS